MEKLALIVLNYNSAPDTVTCVDRLLSFERDYHIVIVDNCSTDGSYETLCDRYGGNSIVDVIMTERNGGYGYGNNCGMRYAIERYDVETVGILNPDVLIPDVSVIESMMSALYSDPSFGVAGGVIIDGDGNKLLNRSGWDIQTSSQIIMDHILIYDRFKRAPNMPELAPGIVQTECVAGCFFLAKASAMKDIGFFDEEMFMYQEESAVGIKCRKLSYKEVIATDAQYYHNHHDGEGSSISFRDKIRATKADYESLKYLCRTYYSPLLIPFLWIVDCMNRIYLAGCYMKGKLYA